MLTKRIKNEPTSQLGLMIMQDIDSVDSLGRAFALLTLATQL